MHYRTAFIWKTLFLIVFLHAHDVTAVKMATLSINKKLPVFCTLKSIELNQVSLMFEILKYVRRNYKC